MSALWLLALRSAWNRRFVLSLTLSSVALASLLLLGIERIRTDVRDSFAQSVSGTDLIVGARSSSIQLVLYSVFRIGNATHNMRWSSVQSIAKHPAVAWAVPVSLGDSHRGFAVLGTMPAYFEQFRYGDRRPLDFEHGKPFEQVFEAVLGAEVAKRLGYRVGDRLTLSHGTGEVSLAEHTDKPFRVTGILARTGTPVDRTVHVSLAAIEAIHLDWQGGAPIPGLSVPADMVRKFDLTPKTVTAVLIGLKTRAAVFALQRHVSSFPDEPLMGVLPGVALDELWQVVGLGEQALVAMSALVVLVGLAGLVSVVLAGLNERRRELAVLRAVGAGPRHVFALLALEGALLTLVGVALGALALLLLATALGPVAQARYGIMLRPFEVTTSQMTTMCALIGVGWTASLIPGWRAYRMSLADGLVPRV